MDLEEKHYEWGIPDPEEKYNVLYLNVCVVCLISDDSATIGL